MKKLILFLTLLVISQSVFSSPVNSEFYLRKLSRRIRGTDPTTKEYKDLRDAKDPQIYLNQKIQEYVSSQDHVDTLTLKLDELFQVRVAPSPYFHKPGEGASLLRDEYANSMDALFRDIVLRNLSWDKLLTGKSYRVYPPTPYNQYTITDMDFYAALADLPTHRVGVIKTLQRNPKVTDEKEIEQKAITLTFAENDPRIAGVLTTARFFGRNVNTPINKNRRRAAAIFRIFLCDDMVPAIRNDSSKMQNLLKLAYPEIEGPEVATMAAEVPLSDIHGSNPECFACHKKLDPMGKTFQGSGQVINTFASIGEFVLPRGSGDLRRPVNGIGGIASEITKTDEYKVCQIKHFWTWYVGEDVTLSDERKADLLEKFDKVGRRVNDFVAYLVSLPEFYDFTKYLKMPDVQRAENVKTLLGRCNQCHLAMGNKPDFTLWPIGGADSLNWYAKIYFRVFIDKIKPMPMGMKLSEDEALLLKDWLTDGAPDETGHANVDSKTLLCKVEEIKKGGGQ